MGITIRMSGAIFISDKCIWNAGTNIFDLVVALLKAFLTLDADNSREVTDKLFGPAETGLDFIALEDVTPEMFNRFVAACEMAYQSVLSKEASMHPLMWSAMKASLSDLLVKLKSDSRYFEK